MAGYFKVPLAAARAIVDASETPDLLAAYLVLRRFAFPPSRAEAAPRNLTAAGAKAIRLATGVTDFRSKRLMDDLRSLRFGDRGQHGLIEPTGRNKGNAPLYKLPAWDGPDAYLPALLLDAHPTQGTAVHRILDSEATPEVQRDALYLLLHLYATTDYAGWMGAPHDLFAYQAWERDGARGEMDFELGYAGQAGPLKVWLVALPKDDEWTMPYRLVENLFGSATDENKERFWPALWLLLNSGLVCKVAVVANGRETYPLWAFGPSFRDALAERGIHGDLAAQIQLLACQVGFDPDNYLIREATGEDRGSGGTGLFFCIGNNPVVRTLLVPRLHAPTAVNNDGLDEVAKITASLRRRINAQRSAARWAA